MPECLACDKVLEMYGRESINGVYRFRTGNLQFNFTQNRHWPVCCFCNSNAVSTESLQMAQLFVHLITILYNLSHKAHQANRSLIGLLQTVMVSGQSFLVKSICCSAELVTSVFGALKWRSQSLTVDRVTAKCKSINGRRAGDSGFSN